MVMFSASLFIGNLTPIVFHVPSTEDQLSQPSATLLANHSSQLEAALKQMNKLANSQREVERELNQIKLLLQMAKVPNIDFATKNLPPADSVQPKKDVITDNCSSYTVMDPRFPHCADKVKWMQSFWQSDSCYASFGVDGSPCSFHIFLSEVERFCPRLPWRSVIKDVKKNANETAPSLVSTVMANVAEIVEKLKENRVRFIAQRIKDAWPMWTDAWNALFGISATANKTAIYGRRRRQTIIVHLGFLTPEIERKWHMAETAEKGGPLGEMVQWADVIASIHALGHEVVLTYDKPTLQEVLASRTNLSPSSCQANKVNVDLIYTDIVGFKQAKSVLNQSGIKCRVRLLDSFGTEPAYNHEAYSKRHALSGQWSRLNMHPKQFYTLYPHSPDNSFMGFVVSMPPPSANASVRHKNVSLVYGKHITMWQGDTLEAFVETLAELTQVHGTVSTAPVKVKEGEQPPKSLPDFVINHGVVSPPVFHDLLWSSKIFVGLGFPYEGPAPLEAIAAGCVFLNPSFKPPHSSKNKRFFKGKPTSRGLTSQNPYAEKFIGEPRVITVDMADLPAVRSAVAAALRSEPKPFIPREFTAVGMLERLNAYIEKQDLCSGEKALWPPESSVRFHMGVEGESCIATCERMELRCEPTHFYRCNTIEQLNRLSGGICNSENTKSGQEIVYPAINLSGNECYLQSDMMLFSCAGSGGPTNRRICPCRDYMPGQLALCKTCL